MKTSLPPDFWPDTSQLSWVCRALDSESVAASVADMQRWASKAKRESWNWSRAFETFVHRRYDLVDNRPRFLRECVAAFVSLHEGCHVSEILLALPASREEASRAIEEAEVLRRITLRGKRAFWAEPTEQRQAL